MSPAETRLTLTRYATKGISEVDDWDQVVKDASQFAFVASMAEYSRPWVPYEFEEVVDEERLVEIEGGSLPTADEIADASEKLLLDNVEHLGLHFLRIDVHDENTYFLALGIAEAGCLDVKQVFGPFAHLGDALDFAFRQTALWQMMWTVEARGDEAVRFCELLEYAKEVF